jgi:hypothetical protein
VPRERQNQPSALAIRKIPTGMHSTPTKRRSAA